VEGRGGDLEENAHQHQPQPSQDQRVILRGGGKAGDLVHLGCAGCAEDQRDAVEQKGGGEGAEQKILDRRFGAARGVLAVTNQNIGRDGGYLQRDEDQQQLDRAGEQAHSHRAEDDQRVELALMVALFGERVQREQQSYQHEAADQHVEEDGEGAGLDGAGEAGSHRQGNLPEAGPQREGGSEGGHPAQRTARPARGQGSVEQHYQHAGQREDDFGKDAEYTGNWIHRWPSPWNEMDNDCGGCGPAWMVGSQYIGAKPITSINAARGHSTAS
jgi:hypothetical protein